MVPVSVRTGAEEDTYQNRVSALFADLATNEPDPRRAPRPAARRRWTGPRRTSGRSRPRRCRTSPSSPRRRSPPGRCGCTAGCASPTARRRRSTSSSPTCPAPSFPLYAAGAELLHFYPVSAIVDGIGLNITVQSYNGNLDFGFVCDRDLVPDVWLMADLLQESMAELLALT